MGSGRTNINQATSQGASLDTTDNLAFDASGGSGFGNINVITGGNKQYTQTQGLFNWGVGGSGSGGITSSSTNVRSDFQYAPTTITTNTGTDAIKAFFDAAKSMQGGTAGVISSIPQTTWIAFAAVLAFLIFRGKK